LAAFSSLRATRTNPLARLLLFSFSWKNAMNSAGITNEPEVLGPEDPPIDFTQELAAFELQREQLVRNHLGKIALVHGDEVVGAFASAGEAMREGFRRFGYVRMMLKEIRDPDPPDFISIVDCHHPSFKPTA
jgi:hypothetical protein